MSSDRTKHLSVDDYVDIYIYIYIYIYICIGTPSRIRRIVKIYAHVDLFLRKPFRFFLSMLLIFVSMRLHRRAKNLLATILFFDYTKAFDYIHRGKMEQILLDYGLPKETVAAIMMLYSNTKVKVRSPDGDTDYFDIVAGMQQGDTLVPYLFIICLDNVLRTSIDKIKENSFKLTKETSTRYPAKTITDADYTDDIGLLANTPAQGKTLLHSLEWVTASIDLHVNAHKTEYMCFTQAGDISTPNGSPLKLVSKFTYLGSRVPSTETDIDTRLAKAWTAVDWLSVIWK